MSPFRKMLLVFAGLLPAMAGMARPGALFKEGNIAYANGHFNEAVDIYAEVTDAKPISAPARYNLGSAQYRSGALMEAAATYEEALSLAKTDALRSRCWYNMANSLVDIAQTMHAVNPRGALDYCCQADWYYRQALECDPAFADAAHNLEVVMLTAASIEEELRKKEQRKQPSTPSGSSSSEPPDDGNESNFEESDMDAAMLDPGDPFGDFSDYEEIRGVPPPTTSDRDILAEELSNQARRKKKRAGEYKAVEKDW